MLYAKKNKTMKIIVSFFLFLTVIASIQSAEPTNLKLHWANNILTISGHHLPGKEIKIHYLEAYCRANSHTTDWANHTEINHKTKIVSLNENKNKQL